MAASRTSKSVRILTIVLLAQASLFYGFSRKEKVPIHPPLGEFSIPGSAWSLVEQLQIDKETAEILKADDLTSRIYQNRNTGEAATLFVAYFETQRTGKTPHSPKNCLPGSGWTPSQAGAVNIPISGEAKQITVNRYVVSHGDNQSIVLYWYQSHNRVVASEYSAKVYTIMDAIRYNRSDTALVRVVVNVAGGDIEGATKTAESFVQDFFEPLKSYLPA
jgi:EpsI family protein